MFVMFNLVPDTSPVFSKRKIMHVVFSGDDGRAVCLESCLAMFRPIVENKPEMYS